MSIYISAMTQGILWSIMGIGLFISFRILRFADLTSEVAFTIGAATSVTAITHHVHPIVATLIAIIAGMIAGLITGILKPVLGNNFEVGWKASWRDESLSTAVALFSIDQKNRSVSVQDPLTNRYYNQPVGHVRSRGLDAEISGHLSDNWKIQAGYTFNTSKYRRTESARYTEGMNFSLHMPKHMLRLYTSYRLPGAAQRWTLGGGLRAQSKTNSLNNVPQGGYAVLDANVRYQFDKDKSLSLIVNNVTDRTYFENNRVRTLGINNFYGAPRTVMLALQWKM